MVGVNCLNESTYSIKTVKYAFCQLSYQIWPQINDFPENASILFQPKITESLFTEEQTLKITV